MAPHHRRRRAIAVLSLAGVAMAAVVLLLVVGGGSSHRTAGLTHAGASAKARALARSASLTPAARQATAENGAINRTLAYTPLVRIAGAQHREIALTFDDGPGPYTPDILSILEREHVPATFFEVGVLERYFYASTARIVADGDVIGDHTQLHAPMSKLPAAKQRAELLDQAAAIGRYGASFPRLFRPPYGLWNATTLRLLHRYRMLMVLWTVDTNDYQLPGVASIRQGRRQGRPSWSDHPAPRCRRQPRRDRGGASADHRRPTPAWLQAGDGPQAASRQPGATRAELCGAARNRWLVVDARRRLSGVRRRRGSSSARGQAGSARRPDRAGCTRTRVSRGRTGCPAHLP